VREGEVPADQAEGEAEGRASQTQAARDPVQAPQGRAGSVLAEQRTEGDSVQAAILRLQAEEPTSSQRPVGCSEQLRQDDTLEARDGQFIPC
jgi:hypothetical protein